MQKRSYLSTRVPSTSDIVVWVEKHDAFLLRSGLLWTIGVSWEAGDLSETWVYGHGKKLLEAYMDLRERMSALARMDEHAGRYADQRKV